MKKLFLYLEGKKKGGVFGYPEQYLDSIFAGKRTVACEHSGGYGNHGKEATILKGTL
jgi:hypothetical protein